MARVTILAELMFSLSAHFQARFFRNKIN